MAAVPLAFGGTESLFLGRWQAAEAGVYEVLVYAYDPASGNTGLDRTSLIVSGD